MTITPTREQSTVLAYEKNARRLLTQVAAHFRIPENKEISPTDAAAFFEYKAASIRPATVRAYRACLMFWLEQLLKANPGSQTVLDAMEKIRTTKASTQARKHLPHRTSSSKAKSIPLPDLITITNYLMQSNADWARRTLRFLQANVASGLRPCEWEGTVQVTDETFRVRNAKHTNGRGSGEFRMVTIPKDDWLYEATLEHFTAMQSWITAGNTYAKYYENCRHTLARAQKAIWPRRGARTYSLYTGRHQWSANTKADGASLQELADGMGHASTETATTHYGKGRSGWRFKPSKDLANGSGLQLPSSEINAPIPATEAPSSPGPAPSGGNFQR